MKYLKKFQTEAEYTAYKDSDDFITPNVSYTVDSTKVFYSAFEEKYLKKAGDIVYYVDGNLETVPYVSYNPSMGTAVGVIVVPESFAPDRKARMVSLKYAHTDGRPSDTFVNLKWNSSNSYEDTTLTNYNRVPTTDNVGSTTTGSNDVGWLPSDNFSGTTSVIDPDTKYLFNIHSIPSPYLNGAANPDYYGDIEGYNNALSDFNGLSNTATLVGLGKAYAAANAADKYSDGVSGVKWYLPAMGELGYLIPRFNEINNAIAAAGGVVIPSGNCEFWSSTEYSIGAARYLNTANGCINWDGKAAMYRVRPFAIVE
jgi:hypothetical protein